MKNIIRFPSINTEDKERSEEIFEWLISRTKDYLDFLKKSSPQKDKNKWCKKFIAVLKFLGDYKIEEDLKEYFEEVKDE